MSSSMAPEPANYIKLLREIRDQINEEIADMTIDERLRWHEAQEVSPELQDLMARAKPPKPPRGRPEDRDD